MSGRSMTAIANGISPGMDRLLDAATDIAKELCARDAQLVLLAQFIADNVPGRRSARDQGHRFGAGGDWHE